MLVACIQDLNLAISVHADYTNPDSKIHGANMGRIWGRQDPGGPHVGLMNFAIWEGNQEARELHIQLKLFGPRFFWTISQNFYLSVNIIQNGRSELAKSYAVQCSNIFIAWHLYLTGHASQSRPKHISIRADFKSLNWNMTTAWYGNLFRFTCLLCMESTGQWWIPSQRASNVELPRFLSCLIKLLNIHSSCR